MDVRWQIVVAAAVLTSAGLVGCGSGGGKTGKDNEVAKASPDFSLDAQQYFNECKENERSATKKYQGKIVELKGVVLNMGAANGGTPKINLGGKNEDGLGVQCVTAEKEPWAKVVPGQTATVRGKGPEFAVVPSLIDCVFVDLGASPAVRIASTKLAEEHAESKEATEKKYTGKYLIVEGELIDKRKNDLDVPELSLKGTDKLHIWCGFLMFDGPPADRLKIGETVKIVGQWSPSFRDANLAGVLKNCMVITER